MRCTSSFFLTAAPRLLAARPRISNDPADRQRSTAVGIDLDRYLIVGSTNAAGLHFQERLGVLDGLFEQLQGLITALRLQLRESLIKDALRRRALTLPHHRVDE